MAHITNYVRDLTVAYPAIKEVWLFGSRANGMARDDSDWDIFAFADACTLDALRADVRMHASHIDLLVVDSETGKFENSWGEKRKKGSLQSWKWRRLSETEAAYEAHQWIPDPQQKYPGAETGDWEDMELKAVKLWPND